MLTSMVDPSRCAHVKKRVYMPPVADEYNSSSQPLNAVVLASILSMMSPPAASKKLREGYIVDLAREGGVSPCALMLGLLYIKRLSNTNPDYIRLISPRDLFLVSMVVASKYMNDEGEMEALTNSDWAKLGCMTKATLDELERNFLNAIDWRLYVPLKEYYTFVNSIEARIALDQASRRGWFTYTDLAAIWEATDIQSSMMLATKQTAKVATRSATLYLMCVATLFAASGNLPLTQDIGLQLSTTNGAGTIGQPSPNPTNYLGHAHAPLPVQQMFMAKHSSMLNFDPMEMVHRKVSKDADLVPCGVALSDHQILSPDVDSSQQHNCLIMGGCDRVAASHHNNYVNYLESGETGMRTTEGKSSSQEGTEPTVATTTDSLDHEGLQSSKTAWAKFEDGLLLLLNLMASITLSSSRKLNSIHKPSSPESSEQSSGTFTTSSNPPHTRDGMDSETTGLSTMRLQYTDSSFQDGKQNAARNVSTYWWDGYSKSWPQTCFIDGTTGYVTTSHNPQLGPSLKHNATLHYSQDEVVSVDTARCVCTSRYSESLVVTSSPNLNTRQLAVDLHWQSGGTGETDQSVYGHHGFNSTPLNLGWGIVNATKLTLTENLLIYANSLLTMAF